MAEGRSSAYDQLEPIRFGTAKTIWAAILLFVGTTALLALLDGKQMEAPLLATVVAASLATGAIWLITESVAASDPHTSPEDVRRKAMAAYVFANAAGTATTLCASFATTLENALKQKPLETHDGLTVILAPLRLNKDLSLVFYLIVTAIVAAASFYLVVRGGRFLKLEQPSNADLVTTGSASLLLLMFGLWIGTPWDAVPFDTTQPMDLLQYVLNLAWHALLLASALLVAFLYCLLVVFALSDWAKVWSQSLLRYGTTFDAQNSWRLFSVVMAEFWYGVLWGTGVLAVCGFLWYTGELVFRLIPGGWPTNQRSADGPSGPLVDIMGPATEIILWSVFILIAVALVVAFVLFFRLYGYHLLIGVWVLMRLLAGVLFAALKFVAWLLVVALTVVAATLDVLVGFLPWLFSVSPNLTRSWGESVWSNLGFSIGLPALAVGPLAKAFAAMVFGWLVFVVVPSIPWSTLAVLPAATTTELKEETTETADAEELSPTTPPRGFEDAFPSPVPVCEGQAGSFDWSLARSDRIEIALQDCMLPERVREAEDAVLVFASVASTGANQQREAELATDRGLAIAQWASRQVAQTVPIYVLNLGMAKSDRSFAVGWYAFGLVEGTRPALAMMLEPNPKGTVVPVEKVLSELSDVLMFAQTLDRFTDCDLFRYERSSVIGQEFERVPEFNCRGR